MSIIAPASSEFSSPRSVLLMREEMGQAAKSAICHADFQAYVSTVDMKGVGETASTPRSMTSSSPNILMKTSEDSKPSAEKVKSYIAGRTVDTSGAVDSRMNTAETMFSGSVDAFHPLCRFQPVLNLSNL